MNVALQFLSNYGAGVGAAGGAAVAAVYSYTGGRTLKEGSVATAGGVGIGAVAGVVVTAAAHVFANVSVEDALNFAHTYGATTLDKLVALASQIRDGGGAFLSQAGTNIGQFVVNAKAFTAETVAVLYTKSVELASISKAAFLGFSTPVQVGIVLGLTALVVGGIALTIFNRKRAVDAKIEDAQKVDLATEKNPSRLHSVKNLFTTGTWTEKQSQDITALEASFYEQTDRFFDEASEIIRKIDLNNCTSEEAQQAADNAKSFLALIDVEKVEEGKREALRAAIAELQQGKPAEEEAADDVKSIASVEAEIAAKKTAEQEARAKAEKIAEFTGRINAIEVDALTLETEAAAIALVAEIKAATFDVNFAEEAVHAKLTAIETKLAEIKAPRPKTVEEQLQLAQERYQNLETELAAVKYRLKQFKVTEKLNVFKDYIQGLQDDEKASPEQQQEYADYQNKIDTLKDGDPLKDEYTNLNLRGFFTPLNAV